MWTWLWLAWLAAFAVIETAAIVRRERGDTLSEHVWQWFSVKREGPWAKTRRLLLASFMGWLTIHFLTGGWV